MVEGLKQGHALGTIIPIQPRRGHSMVSFDKYLFLFGGIQDVTK